MNVYPFIEAEKQQQPHTVKRACELLKVSRSAYYAARLDANNAAARSSTEPSQPITAGTPAATNSVANAVQARSQADLFVELGRELFGWLEVMRVDIWINAPAFSEQAHHDRARSQR